MSYENVLKEAQELGYAEADPSLDVGGQDARSKLKILCRLAFGQVQTTRYMYFFSNVMLCYGAPFL